MGQRFRRLGHDARKISRAACPKTRMSCPTGMGMTSSARPFPDNSDEVIDLAPLSAACRQLVDWYDQLLAGGKPPIDRLDRVVAALRALPPVGGRVGRDIDLIVAGDITASHDDVINAVERLRTLANHHPPPAAPPQKRTPQTDRRPPRRRSKRRHPGQVALPGLEPD